jgi:hypothetical protein
MGSIRVKRLHDLNVLINPGKIYGLVKFIFYLSKGKTHFNCLYSIGFIP